MDIQSSRASIRRDHADPGTSSGSHKRLASDGAPARDSEGHSAMWCLAGVASHFQIDADLAALAMESGQRGQLWNCEDIVRGAAMLGLNATMLKDQDGSYLEAPIPKPAILRWRDGEYVILGASEPGRYEIFRRSNVLPTSYTLQELVKACSGDILIFAKTAESNLSGAHEKYGLVWFFSALWRYRRALSHVLIASLFIQLFALATPIFMQVTIDKILVHSAGATLLIVVIGLLVIGAFDVTLQYLRSYALSHTASRIDVDLNRKVFNHLLKLPLAYFEGNPTGQVIARVREVDSIRAFLTGRGLKALIDISFAVVFILVMFSYSSSLTLVVVLLMPLYIVIIATIMPVLRRRFQSRFKANAAAQQFLIESVIGMQTIKAAAIEATRESQWNERRGAFAQNDFESNVLNNLGQNLVLYVSQLITVSILFFGVRAVMAAEMTIGELIAFNMIAGQVVLPIIRVVEAWQEFQSVHVSVERLGDMMNSPKEVQSGLLTDLPLIQGDVTFRNVSFRYSDEAGDVLQDVSLDIQAGQVIGVVGASGSGKSTLAKLMQRFYIAQRGRVAIDGIDVARVHPRWLRQQIGVVVQDSVLFNRTIHQNIALVTPYMTREQVVAVARLAGAHEFIMSLPRGYDTVLDERGTNLSSGQRQRIALARGLAHDPRILILDEATSSVDYETERTIQRNMKEMVRGRTVIVIAHRLMTVRNCDRILTVEQGRIVEDGTHDELMRIENGRYRRLWSLQSDQNA